MGKAERKERAGKPDGKTQQGMMMEASDTSGSRWNFFTVCGGLGLVGVILVLMTNLIGIWVVDGYNPIRQTISDLAIGDYAWIQDVGLDAYAVGLIASAIALFNWNLGDWKWKAGASLLVLLAIDIFLIAEHNQYAGLPENEGNAIHIYLVYGLGIIFPTLVFLLSPGLRKVGKGWKRFSWAIAVIWIIFAPLFFRVPTAVDGLYERLVALIMLAWSGAIAWLLIQEGNQLSRRDSKG